MAGLATEPRFGSRATPDQGRLQMATQMTVWRPEYDERYPVEIPMPKES